MVVVGLSFQRELSKCLPRSRGGEMSSLLLTTQVCFVELTFSFVHGVISLGAALVTMIGGLTIWLYYDVMQHDPKNFQE